MWVPSELVFVGCLCAAHVCCLAIEMSIHPMVVCFLHLFQLKLVSLSLSWDSCCNNIIEKASLFYLTL